MLEESTTIDEMNRESNGHPLIPAQNLPAASLQPFKRICK